MRTALLLLLLASCGPTSVEDLRAEGESEVTKLTQLLRDVETKEDLQRKLPKIKKRYNNIAELVLQVKAIPDIPLDPEPSAAGDELFGELARLYEMPGCRELIESAQGDAIHELTR